MNKSISYAKGEKDMKKVYAEHYFKSRGLTARKVNEIWEKHNKVFGNANRHYVNAIWLDGHLAFTDVIIKVIYDNKGREYLSVHQFFRGEYGWLRTYLLK